MKNKNEREMKKLLGWDKNVSRERSEIWSVKKKREKVLSDLSVCLFVYEMLF